VDQYGQASAGGSVRAGRRSPLQGLSMTRNARDVVADSSRNPSQGSPGLSEHASTPRSSVCLRHFLLVVSTTARSSADWSVRACNTIAGAAARTAPTGLSPSQGLFRFTAPGLPTWGSPPGVLGPFNGMGGQVRITRGSAAPARSALEVSHLPGGLLPARFAASRPLPSLGFHGSKVRSHARRAALPQRTQLIAAEVPAPRTLRNTR